MQKRGMVTMRLTKAEAAFLKERRANVLHTHKDVWGFGAVMTHAHGPRPRRRHGHHDDRRWPGGPWKEMQ